jgi:hypothetical protein
MLKTLSSEKKTSQPSPPVEALNELEGTDDVVSEE